MGRRVPPKFCKHTQNGHDYFRGFFPVEMLQRNTRPRNSHLKTPYCVINTVVCFFCSKARDGGLLRLNLLLVC